MEDAENQKSQKSKDLTTFTWTIKNFEMCPNSYGKPLKSPEFSRHPWQSSKFHLMLYPRGINQKTSDYVSVYMVRNSGEEDNTTYACELGIMTVNDKMTCFKFNNSLQKGNGKGLPIFVDRDKLLSTERQSLLPGGDLTIFCEMSAKNFDTPAYVDVGGLEDLVKLSKDFSTFNEQEKFCDLDLCTEDRTFKVHKALLDVRFPGLAEKINSNPFKVQSIGTSTMDALLKYVYGGIFNKNEMNLFELVKSPYEVPAQLKSLLITKTCKIHATTCLEKKIVSFSWKIQNCSSLTSESLMRYSLIGEESSPWTWLTIFLGIETVEDIEYLVFSITRDSDRCSRIMCKIEAFDESKIYEYTFQKENSWTLPAFMTKKTLLDNISNASIDEVSFEIKITVTDGSATTRIEKSQFSYVDSLIKLTDNLKGFQTDLKKLFTDLPSTDIKLLVGEEELSAHKFVLSARSSAFSEILQNATSDYTVAIEGFDSKVIKSVLEYMYCGKVETGYKSIRFSIDMYNAANKYDLSGLKNVYTDFLKRSINENNAGDILIAAANCNDEKLKEHVYEYACNFPHKVAIWKETIINRSDLLLELLNKTLSRLSRE